MPEVTDRTTLSPGPEAPMTLDIDLASQQAIAELLQQYVDIIKINDSKRQGLTYIISNPGAIKHILVTNNSSYIKGAGFERVKMLLGNGIIVSDGDFWRRQRTMIQPGFSRKNILKLCEMMEVVTQKLIPKWQHKADSLDELILQMCKTTGTDKVIELDDNLFETGISSLELAEIHQQIDTQFPDVVDISDLFDNPTVREISQFLATKTGQPGPII